MELSKRFNRTVTRGSRVKIDQCLYVCAGTQVGETVEIEVVSQSDQVYRWHRLPLTTREPGTCALVSRPAHAVHSDGRSFQYPDNKTYWSKAKKDRSQLRLIADKAYLFFLASKIVRSFRKLLSCRGLKQRLSPSIQKAIAYLSAFRDGKKGIYK